MNQKDFIPYFPLQINGNLFNDPLLTNLQCRIISLAQFMRLQLMYAKTLDEQEKIKKRFTSSFFANAIGRHRDHIRRTINEMQKSEAVQKYCSIFILPKVELNQEQVFRFTFNDQLPDQLNMRRQAEVDSEDDEKVLDYPTETLVESYLRGIKELSGETARSLIKLVKCSSTDLVKGLIYLKTQLRRKEIKNPKGYLIASFDLNGNFRYNIKPIEYLPADSDIKCTSEFEFEVDLKELQDLEKGLSYDRENKLKFFYRVAGNKAFINKCTEAGKPRNIKNQLLRAEIQFKIVSKVEFENV